MADCLDEPVEAARVIERRLSEGGNAIICALATWGAELREPAYGLIRWPTPLMSCGPEDDEFRPAWMMLALAVNISVAGACIQLRATPTGVDVGLPDGRDVDAVLSADAPIVLGLAAGALTVAAIAPAVVKDGDIAALRAIFEAPRTAAELSKTWPSAASAGGQSLSVQFMRSARWRKVVAASAVGRLPAEMSMVRPVMVLT
ncbi:transcriptional regulator [Rhodococcus baikonurensis]|uniref:transcriptional regulator n=1 Tax=Rhodococcus baikonurensis TaxID=172041 RepID=UPI0037AC9E04